MKGIFGNLKLWGRFKKICVGRICLKNINNIRIETDKACYTLFGVDSEG